MPLLPSPSQPNAATASTRAFSPDNAEVLSEAFSRIGIRDRQITAEHIQDGLRSMNLLLVQWNNRGVRQFMLSDASIAMVQGQAAYTLDAAELDIFTAVLTRDGRETPMRAISMSDYLSIPDKTHTGKPDRYMVERGAIGTVARQLNVWPVPQNSTDVIRYWSIVRHIDAGRLNQQPGISYEWWDAMCAGLAARLAEKYAQDQLQIKLGLAEAAFRDARLADRERAPASFRHSWGASRRY